ncbi:hypothetical protein ACHAW5_007141 [Stephanodiscus triporus]|uniref:Uncharacterized protein n=1 Tax=Stephanodiscus triporus TaxID=2934178 RepID=A0ABD3QZI4_9STRA
MKDPLPVPDQLEKQLSKCKTVRDADVYCKSREKTKEGGGWWRESEASHPSPDIGRTDDDDDGRRRAVTEIATAKAKLPPLPVPSK